MIRWGLGALLLATLTACAGAQTPVVGDNPVADRTVAEQPVEVAPDPGPTRLWREFNVSSQGRGTRRIGDVQIIGNTGTIAVDDKELRGFVYEVQDWKEYGYVLYDVLAVDDEGYYIFYLYCREDALTDIYWESHWDDLEYEKATGACSRIQKPAESHVDFGPVKAPEGLVGGYTIDSPRLALSDDGTGHVDLLGRRYDVYAFSYVGCAECNAGAMKGWDELHVMLDTPTEDCFAILYLFGDGVSGDSVQLGYGFCTTPVKDLPSTVFPARWSAAVKQPQPSNPGQ